MGFEASPILFQKSLYSAPVLLVHRIELTRPKIRVSLVLSAVMIWKVSLCCGIFAQRLIAPPLTAGKLRLLSVPYRIPLFTFNLSRIAHRGHERIYGHRPAIFNSESEKIQDLSQNFLTRCNFLAELNYPLWMVREEESTHTEKYVV